MSGRNDDAFDRQLSREYERMAGPEPRFDVRDVVEQAKGGSSRNRSWFGGMLLPATLAVMVAAFGIFAIVSGIFDANEDGATVGTSPSPTTTEEPPEEVAIKVGYADGSFAEVAIDWERLDSLMESGEFPWPPEGEPDSGSGEPGMFTVTSSDSRLSGDAIVVSAGAWWEHTVTVDDIDDPLPNGLWSLRAQNGHMEIRNADGSWEGPVGPVFLAQGEDPSDGTQGNAPSLEGRVPAVLSGSRAYSGLTAYLSFVEPVSDGPYDNIIEGGTFEAVIVNAPPAGRVSDRTWRETREWVEDVRDGGFAE